VAHLDPDDIVLLALGEDSPADDGATTPGDSPAAQSPLRHLEDCAICRAELAQLTHTVAIARGAGEWGLQAPVVLPTSIWNGIAAELGIGSRSGAHGENSGTVPEQPRLPTGRRGADPQNRAAPSQHGIDQTGDPSTMSHSSTAVPPSDVRRPGWRRGLLIAAVLVLIGAGVGTGVAIGRRTAPAAVALQSQAVLKSMPAGPPTAHGTATVTQSGSGTILRVAAEQLPLRQGFYQVWLYNPKADKMIAVGTLGSGGQGIWTLASTIDVRSYSVVDVSAQDFDGNPAHKKSVLQGPLTQ